MVDRGKAEKEKKKKKSKVQPDFFNWYIFYLPAIILIKVGCYMLIEYIEEALKRAKYEIIDDEEPYYGEIKELKSVWATGKTLEECRDNLKNVIEGWILLSIKKGIEIPKLGNYEIKERQEVIV